MFRRAGRVEDLDMRNYVLKVMMNYTIAFLLLASVLCGLAAAKLMPTSLITLMDDPPAAQQATNIDYVSDPSDSRVLSAVTFTVVPAPAADAELAVRLHPNGAWYQCSIEGSTVICPTSSAPITLEEVVELRVVAT